MTDREMLELAAKAAGIFHYNYDNSTAENKSGSGYRWNPLTDDGDAFRLAVKCEIAMRFYDGEANAFNRTLNDNVERGSDPYAATRRAIVRAAAEDGYVVSTSQHYWEENEMTYINIPRIIIEQALEALEHYATDETPEGWNAITAVAALRAALAQPVQEPVNYTTGHCENKKQKGGCQLHNLQCGWPDCDRRMKKENSND